MKKIIIGLLLISLMLCGCTVTGGQMTVTPACSSGAVSPGFETYWMNWQGLSFLAASTVFLLAAFVYTLGHVLIHQKVIMWAKQQMEEAILAMAITLFVIGFVSFLCTLDLNTLGIDTGCTGANCNLVNVAFGRLSSFYTVIMRGFATVLMLNSFMSNAATMTVGKAFGVGPVFTPLAVFGDVSQSLTAAIIVLMTSAIMVLTQMILLKMTESLFVILFPIGVLLRSFGATRGFGGGLIALSIGFFFFYPLLAVLFYGAVLGDVELTYSGMASSFENAGLSPASTEWVTGNPILELLAGFVGKTIVGAIFMPLVMFMILVSFVKGLSYALGEEVDVSNLTRLI